jgi:hypothetical protein
MSGAEGWEYLAKNNSFSIPDSELSRNSATPIWGGGLSFNKETSEEMMKKVGYQSKPKAAVVEVTERTECFPEGQTEITITHREDRILSVSKTAYVPTTYYQSLHHSEQVGPIKSSVTTRLPKTVTSQWTEIQYYSYNSTPSNNTNLPFIDVIFEFLKTFAQTL